MQELPIAVNYHPVSIETTVCLNPVKQVLAVQTDQEL